MKMKDQTYFILYTLDYLDPKLPLLSTLCLIKCKSFLLFLCPLILVEKASMIELDD